MKKAFLVEICITLIYSFSFVFAQSSWQSIGPNGGYIRCMIKDLQGRILTGNAYGGIFRTSDAGQNWGQIFIGYRYEDVRSLAVNSSNHIFAGTDGHGIYRSTDDGNTWQRLNNLIYTSTVIALLISPTGDIFAGTFSGLYKSTDNGTTFNPSGSGINGSSNRALGYSSGYLFAGSDYNGVFRSGDNGISWEAVNNGIDFSGSLVECFASTDFISDVASKIYVGVSNKIYSSIDLGNTWEQLQTPQRNFSALLVRSNGNIVASASSNVLTIGGGIIESSDEGNNWQIFNLPDVPFSSVEEDNYGNLVGGSMGPGTYVTLNNIDWNLEVHGMPATAVNSISNTGGVILVATRHSGSFASTDEGENWENISNSIPNSNGWQYEVKKNPQTNTVYLLHQNGTFKTTYGNWNSWTNTNAFGNTMGFNSQGHGFLFSGSYCRKTTDDGVTFQSNYIGNISYVRQVTFDASDNLYIATANDFGNNGNGVWRSDDGAISWQAINTNLPLNITAIEAVDITGFGSEICEREIISGSSDGKVFTMNNNFSWNELLVGFQQNTIIRDIAGVNYTYGYKTAALTEFENISITPGCIYIPEEGIPEDIPTTTIDRTKFSFESASTDVIVDFIGTLGNGILKKESTVGLQEHNINIPSEYSLEQNYPNPFNPITTIEFSIPEKSFVNLEVFNALGEKVTTLASKELSAGSYKYEWDGSNLPSGIYLYRLKTQSFSESRKMMLIK